MLDVAYSMLIDDLSGGLRSRAETRDLVDEMLSPSEYSDADKLREYEEQMRDQWGMSEEAIASQDDFWGPTWR